MDASFDVLAEEARRKHDFAFRPVTESETDLDAGGNYAFRANGEYQKISDKYFKSDIYGD